MKQCPVGSKSHKLDYFGSCSRLDLLITVQPISKRFTVLEQVIQVLHLLLCNPLDSFASCPRNGAQVELPSSTHYANGNLRIIIAFKSQKNECANGRIHKRFRNKSMIASIICDGRSVMSVVAFRTAPPI